MVRAHPLETFTKAAEQGADMLFVHHGLSWGNGFKRFVGADAARFRALFASNLSLFAMHLPLDAHKEIGNNAVLAQRLGLTVTSTFCRYHGMDIGMVCKLDAPVPLVDLLGKVRATISPDAKLTDNTQGLVWVVTIRMKDGCEDLNEGDPVEMVYTDKNGKLSYELLNKDLIKFAHASKTVRGMLDEGESVKKIRTYIVCSKFRSVIGNRKLTEAQVLKMAELLDEVSPKSVFKTLDAELRKMSAGKKK